MVLTLLELAFLTNCVHLCSMYRLEHLHPSRMIFRTALGHVWYLGPPGLGLGLGLGPGPGPLLLGGRSRLRLRLDLRRTQLPDGRVRRC